MNPCPVCNSGIDGTDWYIECSGQCGLPFHSQCVQLSPSQYASWTDNVGLLWFCQQCIPAFNPAVAAIRKTTVARVDELEEKLEKGLSQFESFVRGMRGNLPSLVMAPVKQLTVKRLPTLPTEMWELVFRKLDLSTLKKVRLTCSKWNQIVTCSPFISNNFVLKIKTPPKLEDIKYIRKLLASSGQYSNVEVTLKPFENPGQSVWWNAAWQSFGQTIQKFKCTADSETNPIMLEMMTYMPNLKEFTYAKYGITPWGAFTDLQTNIRLEQVKKLELKKTEDNVGMIFGFGRMFSRLNILKMKVKISSIILLRESYEQITIDLLRANIGSLEQIKMWMTEGITDFLMDVDVPLLKRVTLVMNDDSDTITIQKLVQFTKRQSKIERLSIMGVRIEDISDLHAIVRNLPNLRTLKFSFPVTETAANALPSFLATLTKIETLMIVQTFNRDLDEDIKLGETGMPRLKRLTLKHLQVARHCLPKFLGQCPQIRSLMLQNIKIADWKDFPALVSQAPTLENIRLKVVRIHESNEPDASATEITPTNLSNLRNLWFFGVDIPEPTLRIMGYLCPKLELLHLCSFMRHTVTDSTMAELAQTMENLREIKFYGFEGISSRTLEHLVEHCPKLAKVLVAKCAMEEEEARQALRPLKGNVELIYNCGVLKDREKENQN